MQRNQVMAKLARRYFAPELDLQVQTFNLLSFIGMLGGVAIAIMILFTKGTFVDAGLNVLMSVLAFISLRVTEKKRCYHLSSWIAVVVIFLILFPLTTFFCGGYKSGSASTYLVSIIFTTLLLEKWERILALLLEIIIYVGCIFISYYIPSTNTILTEFFYMTTTVSGLISSSTMVVAVVLLYLRIYRIKQEQIEEFSRELKARNEALIRYDKMKSDFLAIVSHEINTPLAVIAASSGDTLDLLKETPINIREAAENQTVIGKRVKLIGTILKDLTDTVAFENGRISLKRQPLSLCEFLHNICDTQLRQADIRGNRITYDFQPNLPRIWADPLRIEQVMVNLLSNAVQHTKDGIITIKLWREQERQLVSVSDTGGGMDEETVKNALNQYVSTKADYWRHGIGLYICRQILTAHGGEIWIESKKGHGTTVSFYLRENPDYE